MTFYERLERKSRPEHEESQRLEMVAVKARSVLNRTRFQDLAAAYKLQHPDVSVTPVSWDSKGRSDKTEIKGVPNSVGIIIQWDKEREVDVTKKMHVQTRYKAVVISATQFGEVSIEGSSATSRPAIDWVMDQAGQRRVFQEALKAPKSHIFTRLVTTSSTGIPRI